MMASSAFAAEGQSDRWHSDKYSMFIHFGLYSYYGGVWDGEPVRRGYSEQIQSHAGIYGDWYAEAAADFDPVCFDAGRIVSLAKSAGMRSVVFTSKHHDGFCMFDTETTEYDSAAMTPSGRDYVAELSKACAEAGMKFGLYFSLIDWNYPHAYPISSHNADFITAQHHELNMAQVRELLTSYGEISELWFDMGSLTPEQSAELYALVKSLQPECMVSGRLGNDKYDFAVMPDNFYPDGSLQAPWQCAASMFDETWSWRSWQERGDVKDKIAEKMRSLVNVVSHGGNYLLNIGPRRDGSVEPFEEEVLLAMGKWLERNGDAIYGSEASPFNMDFAWGTVTRKENRMHVFLSGTPPSDDKILLPVKGLRLIDVKGGAKAENVRGGIELTLDKGLYDDATDIKIITLEFDREVETFRVSETVPFGEFMMAGNAVRNHSYSCFDYYSNYKSTVGYEWQAEGRRNVVAELCFTDDEQGRSIALDVDGEVREIVLVGEDASLEMAEYTMGPLKYSRLRGGTFNGPSSWNGFDPEKNDGTYELDGGVFSSKVTPFSNHVLIRDVDVTGSGYAVFSICAGNGVELVLDGVTVMKHLNPYGTKSRQENVILYLSEGRHRVMLRLYNRFEDHLEAWISTSQSSIRSMDVRLDSQSSSKTSHLKVSDPDASSVHSDCNLHNIMIRIKRK